MMPSTIIDPEATAGDLENSIAVALEQAKAIFNAIDDDVILGPTDEEEKLRLGSLFYAGVFAVQTADAMFSKLTKMRQRTQTS